MMKKSLIPRAFVLLAYSCSQPVFAELPIFKDRPWLGYFAVFTDARTQVAVTGQGAITVAHVTTKNEISSSVALSVQIYVEETLPDGKKTERPIDPASMESSQSPVTNPDQLVIKGKAEGGVVFEILIEPKRDMFCFGGRILDPGSLAHDPLCIVVRLPIPATHAKPEPVPNQKESRTAIRDGEKAFLKAVSSDTVRLKRLDGKSLKLSFDKSLTASPDFFNGSGMVEVDVDTRWAGGMGFVLSASPNSSISIANTAENPLYQGFVLTWRSDPSKDPEGKARLGMRMK